MDNTYYINSTRKRTLFKNPRAGVVPFTVTNNGFILFAFGQDSQSGDITDWGGSIEREETIEEAAAREFKEESLGIFDIDVDILKRSYSVHDRLAKNTIFFPYIDYEDIIKFPQMFYEKKKPLARTEMKRVKIYLSTNIKLLLERPIRLEQYIYVRIRESLRTALEYLHGVSNFYSSIKGKS